MNANQVARREKTDRKLIYLLIICVIFLIGGVVFVIMDLNEMHDYMKTSDSIKHGVATWYAKGLNKDGSRFTGQMYTCASDYFPRYSMLKVKNMINNKTVIVWVQDTHEAPHIMIDLSRKAFSEISRLSMGKIVVKITYLGYDRKPNPKLFGKVQRWK